MKSSIAILVALILFPPAAAFAQIVQRVRGTVVDAESRKPVAGIIVAVNGLPDIGAVTDSFGAFRIEGVPVGRHSFSFTGTDFEPYYLSDMAVIAGKELELNAALKESFQKMQEVTVSTTRDKHRAQNEFATLSARSFSVEETKRYAASLADPARMVQNFPGVSNNGDGDNSIVVRGNSPKGVLWRLEGIEIPSPNHFGGLGSTGGPISMLNANVLGTSDFYTGAFTPEIGNALSGAFDLQFRNGSTTRREHTVQLGALGLEAATEGPFRKGGKSSYLFNYRYSTLAVLGRFLDLNGVQPDYQDASFKLHFPTEKAGTFSVFGLGGYNKASREADKDSTQWEEHGNWGYEQRSKTGIIGASHQYFLSKNAYLKTVISASYDGTKGTDDTLHAGENYRAKEVAKMDFANMAYRLSVLYNQKVDARNTLRTGIVAQHLGYNLNYRYYDGADDAWKTAFTGSGSTQYYQAYAQWKSRLTDRLTLVGGAHASLLALNGRYSIEPRASVAYRASHGQTISLAAGLHSKPDHLSTYLYRNPSNEKDNKDLDLQRAFHAVAGYEASLPGRIRFKAEVYYQRLYNIGVEQDSNSHFSMLNAESSYSLLGAEKPLVSEGTGNNYGVDISLERPFANRWYALVTGSVFKSMYEDYAGRSFSTRFDRGYQANLIFGKEFPVNASGTKTLGLNGKILCSGGQRQSLIDLEASRAAEKAVYVPGENFTQHAPAYFRADLGVYYKMNRRNSTHSIQLDIQNLTNRQNLYGSYYDARSGTVKQSYQLGIFPNISYRIDFH
jgi:hypothetical protein